ncbi:putative L-asparaginase periplasmic [uncultured Alphaproteobacteria bacterium]|uniref:Putative L-asparaginase periplasmic n=1 Tax=uncultured Alphaproteobacteria bacterium TaxID=91750 RepID=A0A212KLT9_9PROT|nr:putative L-asparaginase periplasmic [uncultured Alphaproteobacteria bacterium]
MRSRPNNPLSRFCRSAALAAALVATLPFGSLDAAEPAQPPRVLVLATGGTIAGQADARAAGAYTAGAISGEQLIRSVPGLGELARINAEQVASVGSQDMNDRIWFSLAHRIRKAFEGGEADAVVITHGTDTLEETAFFLDEVLGTDKPVVVVGSMRPSTAIGADGPANLYEAVQVAADPQARGRGVMAVLNDTIHAARRVTKTNTTRVETFASPEAGPIGFVDASGGVRFAAPAAAHWPAIALPKGEALPRVEIVYAHANMDAKQIDHAVADGAKGIVLAGVGDGNASKAAIDALGHAAKAGIVVVRASRVPTGFVNRNVEVDDDANGFVVSAALNPQKSRVLAQLLIANGVTAPTKVQQAFDAVR